MLWHFEYFEMNWLGKYMLIKLFHEWIGPGKLAGPILLLDCDYKFQIYGDSQRLVICATGA